MVDKRLKPCPFCGAEANMWKWNGGVRIDCSLWASTNVRTHFIGIGALTEEEAVRIWNTREEV